ncbi:MAG: gene transfer agent family protein [Hyphomicrobiaceae bacterium]|nr:gene transfer agent family protein [Hyphomicrobiaceae bacterium]
MVNRHRGEIEARLDGKSRRLCLTLGALAELEAAFAERDLVGLAERFEKGRLSAAEAIAIIAAGLRGGGEDVALDAVGRMQAEGGAAGFVDIVARLLTATFGQSPAASGEPGARRDERSEDGAAAGGGIAERAPFRGPR